MIDSPDRTLVELDGVQEMIELTARRVRHAAFRTGVGSRKLAYLSEATKLLNRTYSLVRACYGGAPTVGDIGYLRVYMSECTDSDSPPQPDSSSL